MANGYTTHECYQLIGNSISKLADLTPQERLQIFQILFPQFGEVVADTWQRFDGWTYQIDYTRRPFRAPDIPTAYRYKQEWWLQCLLDIVKGYEPDLAWLAS